MPSRPPRKKRRFSSAGSCLSLSIRMPSLKTILFFLTKNYILDFNMNISLRWKPRKKTLSCSSAAIIGSNDDLLTEILVLLPAKSVVRFKSVSKHWSSLISSEFFTRLHVQNHGHGRCVGTQHSFIMGDVHGRAQFFICHPTVQKLVRVSIPSPIKKQTFECVKILQSWNGLLLLSMKFLGEDRIDYVVFNPTTKQYRLLQLDGFRPLSIVLVSEPSKPEYYKIRMITSIIPLIYSVYDSATQEWSHGMEGGVPLKASSALSRNLIVSSFKQGHNHYYTPKLRQFPEADMYDNSLCDSNKYVNLVQLKPFPEENKLSFRVGRWTGDGWEICKTVTHDFNFKNSSRVRLLGMMREDGTRIGDVVFLFHVPGQLLTYKINSGEQGLKVLVDYRNDYFYVEDDLQFQDAHCFIHTFVSV